MDIVSKLLDRGQFYVARDILSDYLSLLDLCKCRQVCKSWRRFIDEEVIMSFPESKQEKWHYLFGKAELKTMSLDNFHVDDNIMNLFSVGKEIFVIYRDRVSIYEEGRYVGQVEVENCNDMAVTEMFYAFTYATTQPFQDDVVVFAKNSLGQRMMQSNFPEEIQRYKTQLMQSNSSVFFVAINGRAVYVFKLNDEGTFEHFKMIEPELDDELRTLQLNKLCYPHMLLEHRVGMGSVRQVILTNLECGSKVLSKRFCSRPMFIEFVTFLNDRLCGVLTDDAYADLQTSLFLFDLATGAERTVAPVDGLIPPNVGLHGFGVTCVGDRFLVSFVTEDSEHPTVRALDLGDQSIVEPFKKIEEFRIQAGSFRVCPNGLIVATATDFGRSVLADLYEPDLKPKVFKGSDFEHSQKPVAWLDYHEDIRCKGDGPANPVAYIVKDKLHYCFLK